MIHIYGLAIEIIAPQNDRARIAAEAKSIFTFRTSAIFTYYTKKLHLMAKFQADFQMQLKTSEARVDKKGFGSLQFC